MTEFRDVKYFRFIFTRKDLEAFLKSKTNFGELFNRTHLANKITKRMMYLSL
jgi:hypothetical protein